MEQCRLCTNQRIGVQKVTVLFDTSIYIIYTARFSPHSKLMIAGTDNAITIRHYCVKATVWKNSVANCG